MSVWFVIPAHGRGRMSAVAFAGIAWTLAELGPDARALVVADDENLGIAAGLGLDTLERPNEPLGRKWNDGFEYACRNGATHVISCGSDDWVHPDLLRAHLRNARADAIMCSRTSTVVAPDGREAVTIKVGYAGGDGVRMIPRQLLDQLDCRPYTDTRSRALDGAMFDRLTKSRISFGWVYTDLHPWQIVDFKSADNVTPYDKFPGCEHQPVRITNPLEQLAAHYPAPLVARARELYDGARPA